MLHRPSSRPAPAAGSTEPQGSAHAAPSELMLRWVVLGRYSVRGSGGGGARTWPKFATLGEPTADVAGCALRARVRVKVLHSLPRPNK